MLVTAALVLSLQASRIQLVWKTTIGLPVDASVLQCGAAVSTRGDVFWHVLPNSAPDNSADLTVAKISEAGRLKFKVSVPLGIAPRSCDEMIPTGDGGVLLSLTRSVFAQIGGRNSKHVVLKLDSRGRSRWHYDFAGTPKALLACNDGSVFAGCSQVTRRTLYKIDSKGKVAWSYEAPSSWRDYYDNIVPAAEDERGGVWATNTGPQRWTLLHLDGQGKVDATFDRTPLDGAEVASVSPSEVVVTAWVFRTAGSPSQPFVDQILLTSFSFKASGQVRPIASRVVALHRPFDHPEPLSRGEEIWRFSSWTQATDALRARHKGGIFRASEEGFHSWMSSGPGNTWASAAMEIGGSLWAVGNEGEYPANHGFLAQLDPNSLRQQGWSSLADLAREPGGEKDRFEAYRARAVNDRDVIVPFLGKEPGAMRLRIAPASG